MTHPQKIALGELHRKHSVDVNTFGDKITVTDIGHAVVFTLTSGKGDDMKIRKGYTISKKGELS